MARWQQILLGVMMLVATGFWGLAGLSNRRFECSRAIGHPASCVVSHSGPLGYEERFPPGAISAVEILRRVAPKDRSHVSFEVALRDRRGQDTKLYWFKSEADAKAARDRLTAFLTDMNQPGFVEDSAASFWIYPAMVLGIVLGLVCIRGAGKKSPKPTEPITPLVKPTRRWRVLLIAVPTLGAVSLLVMYISNRSVRTWLEIRADHRCKFGGTELLPGGWERQSVNPGTYPVQVWDPDPSGHWQAQTIEVVADRTTVFVCRPSR